MDSPRLSVMLELARSGIAGALGSLFEAAYPDLRALASTRLQTKDRATALNTTTLVHETFLRFAQRGEFNLADRIHFFRYAGRVMRSVIVDGVRERLTQRRGHGAWHIAYTTGIGMDASRHEEEILRINEALERLSALEPRLVDVVQLRYFGGMTDSEIAEMLGVTDRTVRRDWDKARVLLMEALAD